MHEDIVYPISLDEAQLAIGRRPADRLARAVSGPATLRIGISRHPLIEEANRTGKTALQFVGHGSCVTQGRARCRTEPIEES